MNIFEYPPLQGIGSVRHCPATTVPSKRDPLAFYARSRSRQFSECSGKYILAALTPWLPLPLPYTQIHLSLFSGMGCNFQALMRILLNPNSVTVMQRQHQVISFPVKTWQKIFHQNPNFFLDGKSQENRNIAKTMNTPHFVVFISSLA